MSGQFLPASEKPRTSAGGGGHKNAKQTKPDKPKQSQTNPKPPKTQPKPQKHSFTSAVVPASPFHADVPRVPGPPGTWGFGSGGWGHWSTRSCLAGATGCATHHSVPLAPPDEILFFFLIVLSRVLCDNPPPHHLLWHSKKCVFLLFASNSRVRFMQSSS